MDGIMEKIFMELKEVNSQLRLLNEKVDGLEVSKKAYLPKLLSFQEVCEYLGLGRAIVSKMIQTGELPSTRARNRIRVCEVDLLAYIEKNRKVAKHIK